MFEATSLGRRTFFGGAAGLIAAAQLGTLGPAGAQTGNGDSRRIAANVAGSSAPFGPPKQVDAGDLSIGYVETGPSNGPAVILHHGWPYDVHSYAQVGPLLASAGYRAIVPFMRGHGTTRFRSDGTPRSGQQAALAVDTIALMDALKIERAIVGGFDLGTRTVNVLGALWPQRCMALVAVSGYLIVNPEDQKQPLPPRAEWAFWYQFYFATERGRLGYDRNRTAFANLIWHNASPKWNFDDATFARTAAAFDNPDHVAVIVHNYRWRQGLAPGDPRYDDLEAKLNTYPSIEVPTITIGSDFDGANVNGALYRKRFTGKYAHRAFNGVGHNVPQEAPEAFAKAVIAAGKL